MSIGPDANQARIASLSNCQNNGGSHCAFEVSAMNGCAAAAANDYGEIEAASDASVQVAQNSAMSKLQNQQGAHSWCRLLNGQAAPPPPPPPPPPAPPKLGPTVSFNPIRRSGGADHRPQRGVVAVHLRNRQLQPQLRAAGQRHLRPQDRPGRSAIQELELDHLLRQRHQYSGRDLLLSV